MVYTDWLEDRGERRSRLDVAYFLHPHAKHVASHTYGGLLRRRGTLIFPFWELVKAAMTIV
jgi:hypothetical protein